MICILQKVFKNSVSGYKTYRSIGLKSQWATLIKIEPDGRLSGLLIGYDKSGKRIKFIPA